MKKSIGKILFLLCLTVLAVLYHSCKKEGDFRPANNQAIALEALPASMRSDETIENMHPVWSSAMSRSDMGVQAVEVKLETPPQSLRLVASGFDSKVDKSSELTTLVYIESAPPKKRARLNHYIPTKGGKESSSKNAVGLATDFSGRMLTTDLEGNILSGLMYTNGEVSGIISARQGNTPPAISNSEYAKMAGNTCIANWVNVVETYEICIYNITQQPYILIGCFQMNVDTYVLTWDCNSWNTGGGGGGGGSNTPPSPCPTPSEYLQMDFGDHYTYYFPSTATPFANCMRPDLNNSGTYKIGLYVREPVTNQINPVGLLDCPNATWGLTYVYFEKSENTPSGGTVFSRAAIAFLPQARWLSLGNGLTPFDQNDYSVFAACGGNVADVNFVKTVSATEFSQALDNMVTFFNNHSEYDINTANSTDLGLAVTADLGLNLTPCSDIWLNGSGSSAGNLGHKIRQMNSGPGLVVTKTLSSMPQAEGWCIFENGLIQ